MNKREDASFRDLDAFVFYYNGEIYRQINHSYKKIYDRCKEIGLYEELTENKLLIEHCEVDLPEQIDQNVYKFIQPKEILFISYPYEWCFSQLKAAALLTLKVQLIAMNKGMSLKDASAFNVQFDGGKPVFIDTTSFEFYEDGGPWVAYGQFCRHFLAPLLLIKYCDARMVNLLKSYIDGLPLDLVKKLLPLKAKLNPMVFMNICLHSHFETGNHTKKSEDRKEKSHKICKSKLFDMIKSLYDFIDGMNLQESKTEWLLYNQMNTYSNTARTDKEKKVREMLKKISPKILWDIGANTGDFSRIAASSGIYTVSIDMDSSAVEANFLTNQNKNIDKILPLVADFMNPSPGIGWDNLERKSLFHRKKPAAVMLLAIIHHLIISGQITFAILAKTLHSFTEKDLIIEFVPQTDPMASEMLQRRNHENFKGKEEYTVENFENAFTMYFNIIEKHCIIDSERILYFMTRTQEMPK